MKLEEINEVDLNEMDEEAQNFIMEDIATPVEETDGGLIEVSKKLKKGPVEIFKILTEGVPVPKDFEKIFIQKYLDTRNTMSEEAMKVASDRIVSAGTVLKTAFDTIAAGIAQGTVYLSIGKEIILHDAISVFNDFEEDSLNFLTAHKTLYGEVAFTLHQMIVLPDDFSIAVESELISESSIGWFDSETIAKAKEIARKGIPNEKKPDNPEGSKDREREAR